MKLTSRGDYTTRIIMELSTAEGPKPLSVHELAARTAGISASTLSRSCCAFAPRISCAARDGGRNIPPLLQRAAYTCGARRLQLYRYVVLPAMLPSLAQGMKLGWSFAWRSLMAGELIVTTIGIGNLLEVGRSNSDMSLVIAVMLVIIAVGVTVDRLIFGRVESWVRDRWGLAQV